MDTKMKILIGWDGLNSVRVLINHLKQAGLPEKSDVIILTAVDAFMLPDGDYEGFAIPEASLAYMETMRKTAQIQIKNELKQALKIATEAAKKIQDAFPRWTIHGEACADSPAWALVKKAGEWSADLVIVGSHNQPKLGKFFLGSVAQKVVTEAPCSVRVIHGEAEETDSSVRIVMGVDGSPDSELAVNAVANRIWKKGSAVHLVTVVDMKMSTAVAVDSKAKKWIKNQDRKEDEWIHRMSETFKAQLKKAGLTVSTLVKEGDPKRLLMEEAKKWGADIIFVGARGLNMIERFFMGSVSTAVAARAHCSVEVVRPKLNVKPVQNKFKKVAKLHAYR